MYTPGRVKGYYIKVRKTKQNFVFNAFYSPHKKETQNFKLYSNLFLNRLNFSNRNYSSSYTN
jgi:hypothetical protein